MPRRERCILPGVPCHATQRGVDRRLTFADDTGRRTCLTLLRGNLHDAGASLLGWCLMTKHVHLILLPDREDSLAILLRRVHGRFAQYFNARHGRTGHLWQNRFFSCPLSAAHVSTELRYVEMNPVRVGLAARAWEWSSTRAHVGAGRRDEVLDPRWAVDFLHPWHYDEWAEILAAGSEGAESEALRRATRTAEPLGAEEFVMALERQTGRKLRVLARGRPRKIVEVDKHSERQAELFATAAG